ncbi:hypothetical protein [Mesomycoplasma conjunctivae]|uniref:hypothetical protein n=1 Tax=Mesomycoplasma conjunctivae TaxID=45361 RepID=UPI003DA37FCB
MDFQSYKESTTIKLKKLKKYIWIFLIAAFLFYSAFAGLLAVYILKVKQGDFPNDFIEATWLSFTLLVVMLATAFLVGLILTFVKIKQTQKESKLITTQMNELQVKY